MDYLQKFNKFQKSNRICITTENSVPLFTKMTRIKHFKPVKTFNLIALPPNSGSEYRFYLLTNTLVERARLISSQLAELCTKRHKIGRNTQDQMIAFPN